MRKSDIKYFTAEVMLPLFFCMKGFFIVLMFNKADNRGRLFANVEFPITFGGVIFDIATITDMVVHCKSANI